MAKSLNQNFALGFVQNRSHKRYNRPNAGLMHLHAVEEALHYDD